MILRRVVFPHPLLPSRAMISLWMRLRDMSLRMGLPPSFFEIFFAVRVVC